MVNLTNEYKTQMLEWLTGNYQVEQQVDQINFYEKDAYFTDRFYITVKDKLEDIFGPYTGSGSYLDLFRIFQGESANNGESFTIVFGGYNEYGYIMLLDEDSNITQVLTEYSSGTQFKPIKAMGMAEDGTFFMVEETDTYPRFVMLNNILAKLPDEEDYQAVLRKSYIFPSNYLQDFYPIIKKAPGQSKYLMTTLQFSGSNETNMVLELEVNVGTSNEWNVYTISLPSGTGYVTYDIFGSWDVNGDLTLKLSGIEEESVYPDLYYYYSEITINSGTTLSKTRMFPIDLFSSISLQKLFGAHIENFNKTYIGYVTDGTTTDDIEIGYIDYNNNSFVPLYSDSVTHYGNNGIWLYSIDNEVMFSIIYKGQDNDMHIDFGRISNNKVYIDEVYSIDEQPGFLPYFMVSKQFNLYQYKMQISQHLIKAKEIYNSNNYNGTGYQDYNSMIPNSGVILDQNDLIIFARNLYDRLVQGNSITAILQIPYDYVNNIILKTQQLFGETNQKLIENIEEFTKNIYEELMISFINMITMQNKNDPDNIIKNITGAIKLNQSISNTLDYNNTKATKIRINYNDNTTKIMNISSTINGLTATYNFAVYIDNAINTIDIISNDETTTYCSIDASNYEIGKYYKITQEVIIN
jgi:hypothetical protein